MFASLILLTTALLGLATANNFTNTCQDLKLEPGLSGHLATQLHASCLLSNSSFGDHPPSLVPNTVDLNRYIGLNQTTGTLWFENLGKFANYCSNCTLQEKAKLKCNCQVLSAWKPSQVTCLDLNDKFSNDDGMIKFDDW